MAYLISYVPSGSGKENKQLCEAVKNLDGRWISVSSIWITRHSGPASVICDVLKKYVDSTDKLFIAALEGEWASCNLAPNCTGWLNSNLNPFKLDQPI